MTSDQVADLVRHSLTVTRDGFAPDFNVPIDVVTVGALSFAEAMSRTDGGVIREVDPSGNPVVHGVTWFVSANGPFVGTHTPPGAELPRATSGYFTIDDASGVIIGFGFDK